MQPFVLIADDDPDVLSSMADLLHDFGCELSLARDVASSVRLLRGKLPDVIVADWTLKEGGVPALRQALRGTPAEHVPIIVVTGDIRVKTRDAGAAVLLKPFEIDVFVGLVTQTLRQQSGGAHH